MQRSRRPVPSRDLAESYAVDLLTGVGGDVEWFTYSMSWVGHLRVPVTREEFAQMPPGEALDDAGPTGPQRERTRR